MHALDYYTSVCRHVMRADPEDVATWSDLRRLLPCLRQSLGCYVCFSLLRDPMGPNHNVCRHFVCKQCVGGKMRLKPSCSWCKDHWLFAPNPMLKILVTCFKKLCIYVYNSQLGEAIANSCVNGETNNLLQILKEGVNFSDDYVSKTASRTLEKTATSTLSSANLESTATSSLGVLSTSVDSLQLNNSLGINDNVLSQTDNVNDEIVSASSFSIARKAHKRKAIKKSVTFMKKAAQNRSKQKLQQSNRKNWTKAAKRAILKQRRKARNRNCEAPSDLEKIDVLMPAKKRVKVELHPPELKPLSSCNCGKSGNYNQLTCIGQRCPCYSMKLPCMGTCKCQGCRNPKKAPDYKDSSTCSSAVLRSGTRSATESLCVNM